MPPTAALEASGKPLDGAVRQLCKVLGSSTGLPAGQGVLQSTDAPRAGEATQSHADIPSNTEQGRKIRMA